MPAFAKTTDMQYEFKIQRHLSPKEIAGLWDLTMKGPQDESWIKIVDADNLSTVIAKISFIFEQDGL